MFMVYLVVIQLRTTKNEQIYLNVIEAGRPADTTWN